jgi:hypothetical protein
VFFGNSPSKVRPPEPMPRYLYMLVRGRVVN